MCAWILGKSGREGFFLKNAEEFLRWFKNVNIKFWIIRVFIGAKLFEKITNHGGTAKNTGLWANFMSLFDFLIFLLFWLLFYLYHYPSSLSLLLSLSLFYYLFFFY